MSDWQRLHDAAELDYADTKEPKHHPADVRSYLATGIFAFVGALLAAEVAFTKSAVKPRRSGRGYKGTSKNRDFRASRGRK